MRRKNRSIGGRGKRVKGKLSGGKSTAKLKPGKSGSGLGPEHRAMQPAPAAMGVAPMRAGKTGSKLGPEHKRRMGRLEKAAL